MRAILVFVLPAYLALAVPAAAAPPRKNAVAPKKPVVAAPAKALEVRELEILPKEAVLRGPSSEQRLVVLGHYADGSVKDVSAEARYAASRPGIVVVSTDGRITPSGDGSAEVKATLGKATAKVNVRVSESRAAVPISLMRDVVPILTQAGCNSLNCHGSPAGKAGFKLSMYGFDFAADHKAIVTQERTSEKGRRVDLQAPEQSLFLLKPTMQTPHQGGMRFKQGSPEYRTLLGWLQAGAPVDDTDSTPLVTRLEVLPVERVLGAVGEKQRLVVMAHLSDGSAEDVTRKTVFATQDDSVAVVDDARVEAKGSGETVMLARYLGRVGVAQVIVPQPAIAAERDYAAFKPVNYVDEHSLAKWKKVRVAPAELCTDLEFLRRVSLDLTGTLPAPEEIRAFADDRTADKRARKVEELLSRPEYADWWTVFWGDILRNSSRLLQPDGAKAFRDWIRESVNANRPYDQFVRELVTANGATFSAGPANYYNIARTPTDMAEQTAQVFLGVRLQCANCHNHPFEKWTRTGFHQFAAFFVRVNRKPAAAGRNEQEITGDLKRDYRHPETNQVLSPAVPADEPIVVPEDRDRREVLADWLTGADNQLFARNLVNRVWGQLFGRGIVEPVDDVRVTNPPVNEALLNALGRDFAAHRFDVKHVLRTIANSRTYQLSVRATPLNQKDRLNFSRAYHRRLKAEVLLDAVCQATNVPESYNNYPGGTRAIQLTDTVAPSYFMDVFGRPRRQLVCSCEREESANLTQALHMVNGNTLNSKIGSPRGRVADWERSGKANGEIVDELYLWTVSRPPTAEEREWAAKTLDGARDRRQAMEDLLWALLNSTEFLFNH